MNYVVGNSSKLLDITSKKRRERFHCPVEHVSFSPQHSPSLSHRLLTQTFCPNSLLTTFSFSLLSVSEFVHPKVLLKPGDLIGFSHPSKSSFPILLYFPIFAPSPFFPLNFLGIFHHLLCSITLPVSDQCSFLRKTSHTVF